MARITLNSFRYRALSWLILGGAVWLPAQAQTPPDAGQTLRELQRPEVAPPRPATPTLSIEGGEEGQAAEGVRFRVAAIRLTGNTRFPAAELEPLVADLAGAEHSLAELQQAARRISGYYRERGFAVARAYLPAQEIKDGVVTIAVLEGELGKHGLDNRARIDDDRLLAMVAAATPAGATVESARTDRALLLVADLPGVGQVAGRLRPGDRVGTSDFIVTTEPGKPIDGEVSLDNYGNRFTGAKRANARLDVNSPLRLGDRLALQATASDAGLAYGRIAWDAPVGNDGLRLGMAYTTSRYELGENFASLDAHGTASTTSLYGSYPLLRSLGNNVYLGGSIERRVLRDRIDATDTATDKVARSAMMELRGDGRDGIGGGGINQWRLAATVGDLAIDSPEALVIDRASARTEGGYEKWVGDLRRLQAITADTTLLLSATGQWAGKNLDSSEKFVLGGASGIRAYPQGEAMGDEGWLARIELRHALLANLQGVLFYDAGGVTINRNRYAAGANSRQLAGHGVGVDLSWQAVKLAAHVAWRDGEAPSSDRDRTPRLWIQASYSF